MLLATSWSFNYDNGYLVGANKGLNYWNIYVRKGHIKLYKKTRGSTIYRDLIKNRYQIKTDANFLNDFSHFISAKCSSDMEEYHKKIKKDLTKLLKYIRILNIS